MSEGNEGRKGPEIRTFRMEQPIEAITRAESFGTMYADDVVCTSYAIEQICTLTFIQHHPIPKHDKKGLTLGSIESELVLEVKIPLESALRLAFYLTSILEDIKKSRRNGIDARHFGPAYVEKGEK